MCKKCHLIHEFSKISQLWERETPFHTLPRSVASPRFGPRVEKSWLRHCVRVRVRVRVRALFRRFVNPKT